MITISSRSLPKPLVIMTLSGTFVEKASSSSSGSRRGPGGRASKIDRSEGGNSRHPGRRKGEEDADREESTKTALWGIPEDCMARSRCRRKAAMAINAPTSEAKGKVMDTRVRE
jgi:hypothetical protein